MSAGSRDRLLQRLRAAAGRPLSGADLARSLAISRAAVWKQVTALRRAGYRIDGRPGCGYVLTGRPDRLLPAELGGERRDGAVGCVVHHFEVIASTNDEARRLGLEGAPDGTVVVAEEQRGGRGRRGRSWTSPPGGIYLSLLLRPGCHPAEAPRLTLCAAVAVAQALSAAGVRARIKWPNDVLVEGRKVCGILLELVAREDWIDFVVVGVGINANNPPPAEGGISLAEAVGAPVDRAALCRSVLACLDEVYAQFRAGRWPDILDRWRARCDTLGQAVRVTGTAEVWEGLAVDVDADGALVLALAGGGRRRVLAGDVTLRARP